MSSSSRNQKDDPLSSSSSLPSSKEAKRNALRTQVEALHAEMVVADYDINEHTGRSKRKVSRHKMKERTMKRKNLEKEDRRNAAVHIEDSTAKRLRGSKAAFEDDVIKGGLIFDANGVNDNRSDESEVVDSEIEDGEDYNHYDAMNDAKDNYDINIDYDEGGRYEMYSNGLPIDDEEEDFDDDINEKDEDNDSGLEDEASSSKKAKKRKRTNTNFKMPEDPEHARKIIAAKKQFPQKKIARTMYRLRNFKSHRMAEKHGEALGRHARGMNRSAVAKLKEVASAAPIAPQVYSSLGLVYESMLSDELKKPNLKKDMEGRTTLSNDVDAYVIDDDDDNGADMDINTCIELAKKTFGSYHVAALLCKLDYTLWLRAGDAAMKVADLHNHCLCLPPDLDSINETDHVVDNDGGTDSNKDVPPPFANTQEYIDYHKHEKNRWLEEAKNDYLAADNIHPPGVSVPAKLAHAHMQLGNLSEALTILTDLKNNSIEKGKSYKNENDDVQLRPRTELERSYNVWMLYADLMLIIGYECNRWNRGDQRNSNYMFRRWLRKYSITFDWRERRLQSLCLALEAAVGTNCSEKVREWMQKRALKKANNKNDTYDFDHQTAKSSSANDNDSNGLTAVDMEASVELQSINSNRLSVEDLTDQFNQDRRSLFIRNKDELDEFDKVTNGLDLGRESKKMKTRLQKREAMIKQHQLSILELAGQYNLKKNAIEASRQEGGGIEFKVQPLPISASCSTVCDIASQLLKLCLGMELFSFGGIIASAVSLYLKQRAVMVEKRKLRIKEFDERQIEATSNILQLTKEIYDDLHDDNKNESGDDDSMVYLSDEEDFEADDSNEIVSLMKVGIMPPELQLLHGMCLIGQGGGDFLAQKLVQSVTSLDDDYLDESQTMFDQSSADEISMEMFRRAMIDTLSRPAGFALLTDILLKTKRECEWSNRLLPLYENCVDEIERSDEVRVLQVHPSALSITMATKRSCYIKLLLATQRMRLFEAKSNDKFNEAYENVITIVDTIYRYHTTLLLEIDNREINDDSKETIKILAGCFGVMSSILDNDKTMAKESIIVDIISRLRTAVSWFCQIAIPNHDDLFSSKSNNMTIGSWSHFPISSEWQTDELYALSKRTFNLCVSCNVSAFSGWEKDEFDLSLMRQSHGASFFGVDIKGKKVTGYLNHEMELELSRQWKQIETLLPTLSHLDFDNSIKTVKTYEWFITAMKTIEENFTNTSIASFAEDEALYITLLFAKVSLLLAHYEKDERKHQCLVKNAMSIVFPMTQFCLDEILWDSEIGTNATRSDGLSEWEHFGQNSIATSAPKPPYRQRPPSMKKHFQKPQSKFSSDSSTTKRTSPLATLAKVPAEILLREWNGKEDFDESDDEDIIDVRLNKWSQTVSGPAKLAMKRIDYTLKKLRQSTTINSLQKSSLEVAFALIELVSTNKAWNPFLCLHQAAVFASQGLKGGNNDEEFKKPLPEETDCTPNDALCILGRADCLRAIHFTDEAVYLCSYIARVCRLHRDKTTEFPWTPKWRVVGIYMYTISVAINETISSFMDVDVGTSQMWEKEVKAEISRARSDAIGLQRAFSHHNGFSSNKFSKTIDTEKNAEASHGEDNNTDGSEGEYEQDKDGNEDEDMYDDDYDEDMYNNNHQETIEEMEDVNHMIGFADSNHDAEPSENDISLEEVTFVPI